MLRDLLTEKYQPDNPRWGFPLPRPEDRNYAYNNKGYLVHAINPTYLSYWFPDIGERGFFFVAGLFGLLLFAFAVPPLYLGNPSASGRLAWEQEFVVAVVLFAVAALMTYQVWSSLKRPVTPPIYLNRVTKQVIGWSKDLGWMVFDWDRVTPVIKRFTLYNIAGRQTIYTLALLDVDPKTKRINRVITVYPPERMPDPVHQAWDFMRRYMNEPPQDVPAAVIPPQDRRSHKHWVVRMQIEALEPFMNPDTGELAPTLNAMLFMPIYGALVYPLNAAAIYIQHKAPTRPLPPELAQRMTWSGGTNPYKVESDTDGAGRNIERIYQRVKRRHRLMMIGGFGVHVGLLVLMVTGALLGSE